MKPNLKALKRGHLAGVLLIVVVLVAAACGSSSKPVSNSSTTVAATGTTVPAAGTTVAATATTVAASGTPITVLFNGWNPSDPSAGASQGALAAVKSINAAGEINGQPIKLDTCNV